MPMPIHIANHVPTYGYPKFYQQDPLTDMSLVSSPPKSPPSGGSMSRFRPSEQIVSRMKMFFQGGTSSSSAAGNLSNNPDPKEKRRRRSKSPEAERREAARR